MDRLEARARILFGSLGRRLARLLGWSQLSISLRVGLATFNLCTCSTRSHSVARTPPAERPPPRRAFTCRGRFVFFCATPRVPRKPAQRHHPSVEVFPLFCERYCVALGFRAWCFRIKHWECACGDAHPCGLRDVQTRRKAAQSLGASSRGGGRIAEQSGGATKLRPKRGEGADASRSPQWGVLILGQSNEGSPSLGLPRSGAA